jgi:hypothetical protein
MPAAIPIRCRSFSGPAHRTMRDHIQPARTLSVHRQHELHGAREGHEAEGSTPVAC